MLLVQKPYGLGGKAIFESGSPCSDAPLTSARRQQCENSTAWVAVVLDNLPCFSQASCVVDALHRREMSADDMLRCLQQPLQGLAIRSRAATIPGSRGCSQWLSCKSLLKFLQTCQTSLGSARQEVQDPVTQGGFKTQAPEFRDELGRHNRVER